MPAAWRRSNSSFPTTTLARRQRAASRWAATPRRSCASSASSSARSAKAMPDRATAAPFGTINALSLAGHRDDGQRWVMFSFFGGGLGGNPDSDGLNHGNNPDLDGDHPAGRNPGSRLSRDVHAMGAAPRQRGAPGCIAAASARSTRSRRWPRAARTCSCSASAARFAPFGVGGGGSAALNRFCWQTECRRDVPADGLQGHRREDRQRPARAPRNARRRRLGRPAGPRSRQRRPRRPPRLHRAGPPRATTMPSCSRRMALSTSPRRGPARPEGGMSGEHDRRRRCRRHLHRPVPVSTRPSAASAPPRCRPTAATRPSASSNGLRALGGRSRLSAPSCTAPPSAPTRCWSARARRSASSPRAASATCWRCAAATGRNTWGLWGDFLPIADRDMRLEVPERTLADGTIRDDGRPRRGPRRGARPAGAWRARRSPSSSSTATPTRPTSAPRRPPRAPSGRTRMSRRPREILPEIREFERASTTALNAYLQPVVGSLSRQARSGAGRAMPSRASSTSSSRTAASCRRRRRASCRCARRCRARPPA